MLRPGVAPEVKERAENRVNELIGECRDIEPKMHDAQAKHEALQMEGQAAHAKMKDAQKGRSELHEAKRKLDVLQRKLKAAEEDISNDTVAEKKGKRIQLKQYVEKYLESLQRSSDKYQEYLKATTELSGVELSEEGKRQSQRNLE